MTSETRYCLVLSGGGAKGVYHLGVWRALRELGIEVDALVGTSIGAIVAAFLAQGAEDLLENIVRTMTLKSILDLPPELVENGELKWEALSLPVVKEVALAFLEKRGLDTSPMRRILEENLNEDLVRQRGKDLGFVTVNLSDLTPREVFLQDIPPGKLVDYLMASAAFPGFEAAVIDGKRYVDGGLHDNIPYDVARARGYRQIIVSDASGVGRNRKMELEGSLTAYIRSSIRMGSVLEMNRQFLQEFQLLGYLDTLRTFGKLTGYSYFVEPDPQAERAFTPGQYSLPERMRHDRNGLLVSLECAAHLLEVPRIHAYSYQTLAEAIGVKREEEEVRIRHFLGAGHGGRRALAALVRREVTAKSFQGCSYYTWRLLEELFPGKAGHLLRRTLESSTPEFPAGLAYLKR